MTPQQFIAEGPKALGPTPLLRPLPRLGSGLPAGEYLLVPEQGGSTLAATVIETPNGGFLGFVIDQCPAEQSRTFRVEPQPARGESAGYYAVEQKDGSLGIECNGVLLTILRQGEAKPYFWPLLGPEGAEYTRAYPMEDRPDDDRDHPHQRSFWITHGDVNGVNFWATDPKNEPLESFGRIQQQSAWMASGSAFGRLRTTNLWLNGRGKPVLEDERLFTFWSLPHARVIDVEVRFHAGWGPVTFGDTKEGTFGLRVPSLLDVKAGQGGQIVNAEGVTDQAAWGKPSPWVDYSGKIAGKSVGIAIFDHPDSFRHPTTWHVRDYGLFAANPFGYHDFGVGRPGAHTVPPGGGLTLKYRVLLHQGDAKVAGIESSYEGFARPPSVILLSGE